MFEYMFKPGKYLQIFVTMERCWLSISHFRHEFINCEVEAKAEEVFFLLLHILFILRYTFPPVGGGRMHLPFPCVTTKRVIPIAARLQRGTTPAYWVTCTGPKRCDHSQGSRAQFPVNFFYTWCNMLHHSPGVSINFLLHSNSSILLFHLPPLSFPPSPVRELGTIIITYTFEINLLPRSNYNKFSLHIFFQKKWISTKLTLIRIPFGNRRC